MTNFATLDLSRVLESSKKLKSKLVLFEGIRRQQEERLQKAEAAARSATQVWERAENDRAEKELAVERAMRNLQHVRSDVQQELEGHRRKLEREVVEAVRPLLGKLAEQRGIQLVMLPNPYVAYAHPNLDLSLALAELYDAEG